MAGSILTLWLVGALLAVRAAIDTADAAGSGWRLLTMAGAVVGAGMFASFHWLRAPQGTLRWDGQDWWWQAVGKCDSAGIPALRLDLQHRLLVRWLDQADGSVLWFWLDAGATHSGVSWHALRCALHARPDVLPDPRADDKIDRAEIAAGTSA